MSCGKGSEESTSVMIVGGGPAGLVLAIELGQRGIKCVLVEQSLTTSSQPKANLSSARTMEHYRRLGFSDEIRAVGLPPDYPQDVTFWTRYNAYELSRFKVPTSRQALAMPADGRREWQTPELPHRVQQMAFEPILRQKAESLGSVSVRYGHKVMDFREVGGQVQALVQDLSSGTETSINARYLIGCDGARSTTRKRVGIEYQGEGSADREFFGGKMLGLHFRSSRMYELINGPPAWHYWTINGERRGLLVALDGCERFTLHIQMPRGTVLTEQLAKEWLTQVTGVEVPIEVLGIFEWTAGYTLVADRYSQGRVILAGDSAHLFTPAAGLGYNTSIDDVANLGWKLAATVQGWGGPRLLESYGQERRPIAVRNTEFARRTADRLGCISTPNDLEKDTPEGADTRREIGNQIDDILKKEFQIPGLILGVRYEHSSIVMAELSPPPEDDFHVYRPTTRAGSRAPHIYLKGGMPIFDRFGKDFTLLRFNESAHGAADLIKAAEDANVPITSVLIEDPDARQLYERDLVLIRPDHHIAWRGNTVSGNPAQIIATTTGN
jgi:2-polyprenyl-6-methoxyphenol hydroxylase-like FAD-dependent oxidoreductase